MPRSGRHGYWSADDVPDLAGRVAVVTGANSGIGLETARALARGGAHTILACRSKERGQRAIRDLRAEMPDSSVELMELDLGSLASIQAFALGFAKDHGRLDMLINNAGIMAVPHSLTGDGFESQMGINHLGHYALTGRLLEALLSTPGARVVTVSSVGHRGATMDFENLLFENGGYTPFRPYWRSKLANLLFTYELQRRFRSAGAKVSALAAHPGVRFHQHRRPSRLPLVFADTATPDVRLHPERGDGRPAHAASRGRSGCRRRPVLRAERAGRPAGTPRGGFIQCRLPQPRARPPALANLRRAHRSPVPATAPRLDDLLTHPTRALAEGSSPDRVAVPLPV